MSKAYFILIPLLLLFFYTCSQEKKDSNEKPVARAYDKYLFPSDLQAQIPPGLGIEDSARIARRLIEEWIQDRLLLKQAELHLPEDIEEIERQVEEYRTALMIFRYKQNLLGQNLDSLISRNEIEDYYKENSSNYVLETDIVQVTYLKIPVSAPDISNVRRWYRSDSEEALESLLTYSNEYAAESILRDTSWISFVNLIESTPLKIDNPSRYLNYNKNIETRDSEYYHFIRIHDRKREGELKPISMVDENIRTVLLNKRKLEYLQNLENTVYKEGLSRNQVDIY